LEKLCSPPDFDDYLEEEQQSPTSPFACQSSQTTYDSYESESELDMLDFQEQVAEPYPLLAKENYHEEISYLSLSGDAEQYEEEQNHPMVPIYDEYESDLGETEPEEQNISCPEPVSKQPPPWRRSTSLLSCPPPTCAYQRYSATGEQLCSRGGVLSPIFWNWPLIR
jgi:hypothetical protein